MKLYSMQSFFRYPGGKSKFKTIIQDELLKFSNVEYREPFFGGGSIGLSLLSRMETAWVNDKDYGIYSLWASVKDNPEELKKLINDFVPSVDEFYRIKKSLLNDKTSIVETGFNKLAIHQLSFSGLGLKSGGPLGGRTQESKYKIDCRWSPESICKKIETLHIMFQEKNIKITHDDFEPMITTGENALIYLDPPYFDKGADLYHHAFTAEDHERLRVSLKKAKHDWVLSYDDCPEIRDLYDWAYIKSIDANYTIKGSTQKTELIIMKQRIHESHYC